MKAVFVGGGSHRLLGILRSAMAVKGVLDGGELALVDLAPERAEAVGRLLQLTPEYARARPRIVWGSDLDRALEGADYVGVVLLAGSRRALDRGDVVCARHGFLGGDNVSPSGAFLGLKTGPIVLDLARRMERRCPQAWLVDFANPVAVASALVNNHTRIRCLGVCAGQTNHQWDLTRLLGTDEQRVYDVEVAGVNHLSFILRGAYQGQEIFKLLERRFAGAWRPPRLQARWGVVGRRSIANGLRFLKRIYEELGVLVFSTEWDGMAHLMHEEVMAAARRRPRPTFAQVEAGLRRMAAQRAVEDAKFRAILGDDLGATFWSDPARDSAFLRQDEDVFVKTLVGVSGAAPARLVASRPNGGAIEGVAGRTVVEYSMTLSGRDIHPDGCLALPPVVSGLTHALAVHQTMLADAIAADDPRLLARALLAYPVRAYARAARALYRDLFKVHADEIPPRLRAAAEIL